VFRVFYLVLILSLGSLACQAQSLKLTADDINAAELTKDTPLSKLPPAVITKTQILLDRARFSPGEIDAKLGENFEKALRLLAEARGMKFAKTLTMDLWQALQSASAGAAIVEYNVSDDDVKGPFLDAVPDKMENMQDLESLSYTSAEEKLAERFHMSQALLQALNRDKRLGVAGETIWVANVKRSTPPAKADRVEIDPKRQVVRIFAADGSLSAAYPATVGSTEKPSPQGERKITGIQENPTYRYDPKYAFKGVRATRPFTIKPGPNNPVGSIWIGLSEKGYGIHGTGDPAKVSKSESHGCVRLTNWDAHDLASRVRKGVSVMFLEPAKEAPKRRKRS
jgi:lipoprotein-anchoring transpeptidase ErfK/SrfK